MLRKSQFILLAQWKHLKTAQVDRKLSKMQDTICPRISPKSFPGNELSDKPPEQDREEKHSYTLWLQSCKHLPKSAFSWPWDRTRTGTRFGEGAWAWPWSRPRTGRTGSRFWFVSFRHLCKHLSVVPEGNRETKVFEKMKSWGRSERTGNVWQPDKLQSVMKLDKTGNTNIWSGCLITD